MRILVLCTDSYGGHGGIALYNRDLIEALAARADVEQVTVIPRVIRRETGPIPAKVEFIAKAATGTVSYLNAVARERLRGADLVICGHVNLLPVAFNRPILLTYGIEAWKPLRSRLSRALLHRCRAMVSISAITRDRFLAWSGYRGPTFLLPNAIHLEQYAIREKRQDLIERYKLQGRRVLLTVGRLESAERYKGFDEVMEVLPGLPDDVVYLIAGGGNDFERLQRRAIDLGVVDRVRFTGLFPERDKPDLYALADVYVMPSRGEGFGFVFLEALACGIPVIGSKHDGGREALLDGELGLLVDPANRAEIAAAIRELLARPERRVPPRLVHFSFTNFAARAGGIVEKVLMR
jgi:phosphatidylinositol alpha-1,6-mannosyltransferase